MIDIGNIISGIIGAIGGGGISWIFFIRENKAGSEADAVDKSAVALKKVLDLFEQQQEVNNRIIKDKDDIIAQQSSLIEEYKRSLDEYKQQQKEFQYKLSEAERKITGMQKMIDIEIKERKFAEENICLVEDCELRKPKRGTYKKETV